MKITINNNQNQTQYKVQQVPTHQQKDKLIQFFENHKATSNRMRQIRTELGQAKPVVSKGKMIAQSTLAQERKLTPVPMTEITK